MITAIQGLRTAASRYSLRMDRAIGTERSASEDVGHSLHIERHNQRGISGIFVDETLTMRCVKRNAAAQFCKQPKRPTLTALELALSVSEFSPGFALAWRCDNSINAVATAENFE